MGLFSDTFKPIDVSKERDELGRQADAIEEGVSDLAVTAPSPMPTEPALEPEPTVEEPTEEPVSSLSKFVLVEDTDTQTVGSFVPTRETQPTELVSGFGESQGGIKVPEAFQQQFEEFQQDPEAYYEVKRQEQADFIVAMLPEGVEPGSYSPDDLAEDDRLYDIIKTHMDYRFGIQATQGKTKEQIVERFLNNRRGTALAGNAIRVFNETDYIDDISEDPEKLEAAGRAYTLYEQMAGITSENYSWGEAGWSFLDVVREVGLDPVTWVTAGIGKAAGGIVTKSAAGAIERTVTRSVQNQLARGVSASTVRAQASTMYKTAAQQVAQQGSGDIARFAAATSTSALERLATRGAVVEVATATVAEAVAGGGAELLYQQQLVKTGVQEEVNQQAVGLAALGSLFMGGLATARVATRGFSGTSLPSETLTTGTGKKAADSLRASIAGYFSDLTKELDRGTSWASKVNSGKELDVQDTNFFIDLLLGVSTKTDTGEDKTLLKGLAQTMQEEGFYFTRRTEDDKISNFIADFITTELKQDDIKGIIDVFEQSSGTRLTGFVDEAGDLVKGTPTPEQFANAFATKINGQARGLNSVSQAANRLSIDLADMDVEQYLETALGQRLVGKTKGDLLADKISGTVLKTISANQNRYIRALVSHLGTSKLNVIGWAVSSGMESASDLLRATGHLGVGQVQQMFGLAAKGAENTRIAKSLLLSNANRVNLMLDNDMTAAAFNSAVLRNAGSLDKLARVQAGGVDVGRSIDEIIGRTRLGTAADTYIDVAQTATLVKAQDVFTKSQEYVFQMDKALRLAFDKSWNDFYKMDDAAKIMATKQYREIEETVVGNVMMHTFSQSFKGKGVLGEIAGILEDARGIPLVGMMVPFGKFFNNTVAFSVRNTPVINQLAKLGGAFSNKSHTELLSQGAVAGGLVYSYAQIAQDKRRQGLGMYEVVDETTGEVRSREYDYPLSLFMGVGHAASYLADGEAVPSEVTERLLTDFGISGLTRGLTTTTDGIVESFKYMAALEFENSWEEGKGALGSVMAQYIAGMTRPLEGLDTLIGLSAGMDMRPQNIKDGNKVIGKALSYVDNTYQLFTGQPFNDPREGATTGKADADTGKQLGTRTVRLTDSMRVMNLLDYEQWDENAEFRAMQMAAGAGNAYNRLFFEQMEKVSGQIMADEVFLQMPLEQQRGLWDETVSKIREEARLRLSYEYSGEQSTFSEQLELTDKYTRDVIRGGMRDLGYEGDLGDLSEVEINLLAGKLESARVVEQWELGGSRAWSK